MKTLIAGPWIGEFGWELFAWQGYIRALAKKHDTTIVISRPNSKALYEDFADAFYEYTPPDELSDSFFMYNVDIKNCLKSAIKNNHIELNKDTVLLLPRRIGLPPFTHYTEHVIFGEHIIQPEYICFGKEEKEKYDYIFHIRERELRQEDNWGVEKWKELKILLGNSKIGCIGTKKESGWIEGTDDLRDLEIKSLLSVLHNSACVFGPSSGPMHLASLCGTPHVVWSKKQNRVRYEENWNPLKSKILFMDEHQWHPPAEYVHEHFLEWSKNV